MSTTRILYVLAFGVFLSLLSTAVCFRFTKLPHKPLIVYYRTNRTNVELRWEWTLAGSEVVSPIKIRRYRKNYANTETILATYHSSANTDVTKYGFTVENTKNGYASFVIKDITDQGTGINVMAVNEVYVYKIAVEEQTQPIEYTDEVELNTFKTPAITKYPRNQTASGGTVTFECTADGKPTPIITWEKVGSSQSFSQGSLLTITNFDASKVGVYICTAKSNGIARNATATGYLQFSTCESSCDKEELGIEFTDLTYNYEYETSSYSKYEELKNKIETECLMAYAKSAKAIRKCEVKLFRRGSVVAVVELGWPTGTQGPKDPLLQAIRDGNFAGYKVKTDFVSATSTPTQIPTTSPPKDINECVSNPCRNEGTCTNKVNGFSCTCATGWEGQNCGKMTTNSTTPTITQKPGTTTAVAIRYTSGFINVWVTIVAALGLLILL